MERIIRDGDPKLYQPLIRSELIRELYRIKQETGIPMNKLLDMAITEFIDKVNIEHDMAFESDLDRVQLAETYQDEGI